MTLLYGQFPLNAFVVGQFVLHALVGSVADVVEPIPPPIPPPSPSSGGGGGGSGGRTRSAYRSPSCVPTYIRRDKIMAGTPGTDEDTLLALAALITLDDSIEFSGHSYHDNEELNEEPIEESIEESIGKSEIFPEPFPVSFVPTFIRRDKITSVPPKPDEDTLLALAALITLDDTL